MSNPKPNFQTCCREVAENLGITTAEMHPSTYQVVTQAAQLYADRCVEEATEMLRQALMDIMTEIELYKKSHSLTP